MKKTPKTTAPKLQPTFATMPGIRGTFTLTNALLLPKREQKPKR